MFNINDDLFVGRILNFDNSYNTKEVSAKDSIEAREKFKKLYPKSYVSDVHMKTLNDSDKS